MTLFGTHADKSDTYSAADIVDLGLDFVRHSAKFDGSDRVIQWIAELAAVGVKSMLAFTWETFPNRPHDGTWRDAEYLPLCMEWAEKLQPYIDWIIIESGNEVDLYSPSSWTMSQAEANALLRSVRKAFPTVTIIGMGYASGRSPEYEDGVVVYGFPADDPCPWDADGNAEQIDANQFDWRSVHPYGCRPEDNWPLNEDGSKWGFGYWGSPLSYPYRVEKPYAISEVGVESWDENDQDFQAEYLTRFFTALSDPKYDVRMANWFAFMDSPGLLFGLIDQDGNKKKSYHAYQKLIADYKTGGSSDDPPVSDTEGNGDSMKIEDFAKKNAAKLGKQWGSVFNMAPGVRMAGFDHHIVWEINGECWVVDNDDSFFQ